MPANVCKRLADALKGILDLDASGVIHRDVLDSRFEFLAAKEAYEAYIQAPNAKRPMGTAPRTGELMWLWLGENTKPVLGRWAENLFPAYPWQTLNAGFHLISDNMGSKVPVAWAPLHTPGAT